jgi:hypothetical protein
VEFSVGPIGGTELEGGDGDDAVYGKGGGGDDWYDPIFLNPFTNVIIESKAPPVEGGWCPPSSDAIIGLINLFAAV